MKNPEHLLNRALCIQRDMHRRGMVATVEVISTAYRSFHFIYNGGNACCHSYSLVGGNMDAGVSTIYQINSAVAALNAKCLTMNTN